MRRKHVCLIVHPREGQNFTRIAEILLVFSAAGWQTDVVIKAYGGHTIELAHEAAQRGYDLIIAYGGDGTVSQVINGVMSARRKGHGSAVGVLPGGTANLWATEMGIPADPIKAALTLVNSEVRRVDVGHIEVAGLSFPGSSEQHGGDEWRNHDKKERLSSCARHYFLLMAGLGIDAAVLAGVKASLKHRLGVLAINLSALQTLPEQHPFPLEIQLLHGKREHDTLWQGEALEVVFGNTRRRANAIEMTPGAYIDDGLLDACVITSVDALSTLSQAVSLLLQHKPDELTTEFFSGKRFSLRVPASVALQLDGSAMKLKAYLGKQERARLQEADPEQVMVAYHFAVLPSALNIAVPSTYEGNLFEHFPRTKKTRASEEATAAGQFQQQMEQAIAPVQQEDNQVDASEHTYPERLKMLQEHGRKVVVAGVAPNSGTRQSSIVAGYIAKPSTGELKPGVVLVDENTLVLRPSGEAVSPTIVQRLQEGMEILVESDKRKRGIVSAKSILI